MYLTFVKGQVVDGLRQVFDSDYPVIEYRDLRVSVEYPRLEIEYPSIWVDFDPVGQTQIVGIGHTEDNAGSVRYRWRFAGTTSLTIVAMSSLERDRLFDAVMGVLAFSKADDQRSRFRQVIEGGEFIGMNMNFDAIDQRGFGFAQGTPWNSDDFIYEATIGIETNGEYVSDDLGELTYVSGIDVFTWFEGSIPTGVPGGDSNSGWITETNPPPGYELA